MNTFNGGRYKKNLEEIASELDRIVMIVSSINQVVELHECLNPVIQLPTQNRIVPTSNEYQRSRTRWSMADTERFANVMDRMTNSELAEHFSRPLSEIVNKRRVEGRKRRKLTTLQDFQLD